MARPRSEDKRGAILDAAIAQFAARGAWTTPTAAISKAAGVAEGTLFTYFPSKDVLVNELYRALKLQLADAMFSGYPESADAKTRMRHVWDRYVQWGASNPERFKVMGQLMVSDRISTESRTIGYAPFVKLERLAKECIKAGLIRNQAVEFIGAMFGGLAESTMNFMAQAGKSRVDYGAAGFEVFWQGIAVH